MLQKKIAERKMYKPRKRFSLATGTEFIREGGKPEKRKRFAPAEAPKISSDQKQD
jgi:hypothetical protein